MSMPIPSPEGTSSWFPDLAVDHDGNVHVVWCESDHLAMNYGQPGDVVDPSEFDRVYYSMWDGVQWSPPNDIVPSQQNIIRNAIVVDDDNMLHLLFDFGPGYGLYHKQAQPNQAWSAAAWSPPRLVNGRRSTYMSDIATYQDTLHIVYDDAGVQEGECPGCADIYYRHSTDRGRTWSIPVDLSPTDRGEARAQIEIDSEGTIHVAWDEGYDRLSGYGEAINSVYRYSTDGGETWSEPTVVTYPNSANAQLTVGSDGQGGVMLVWRTTAWDDPGIYYMWSTDGGETFSRPQTLPDVAAKPWTNRFDLYDMATDSAGHIHLLVGGILSAELEDLSAREAAHGLYHLEWDGAGWSSPALLYRGGWYPEYPRLVIERGNQLHATWHVREQPFGEETPHQIWYAHGQSGAAAATPPPPMATLVPIEPAAASTPTPTPTDTNTIAYTDLDPAAPDLVDDLYTESDEVRLLMVALSPVLALAIVLIGIRSGWFNRLFR
jgi:hypothetical protein